MTTNEFDRVRPPDPPGGRRRRRRGGRRRGAAGGGDGGREMSMVPDLDSAEVSPHDSYYNRPVVKPPPWDYKVASYLFLGGLAGGSGLLAAGAQLTGRPTLRRNSRLTALGSVALGGAALVADLGRPERFVNMLRTVKLTSPMSLGSWILAAFSGGAGVAAVNELDRITGARLPLGPLRRLLRVAEAPAGLAAAGLAAPLAVYTAVLLSDTAVPTWNDAKQGLPFVFVGSASLAASGMAMLTTPVAETGPARRLAVLGVLGELIATRLMHRQMDPLTAEPLRAGKTGKMLQLSEMLAVAGGIGTVFGGRRRPVAAASGVALMAASALTRFGIFEAGLHSARDPKYTIEPQKRRLAARRAAGVTDDSITTVCADIAVPSVVIPIPHL